MILTCPLCTTRYLADAKMFAPPGRNVRCAKCGQVWFQAPAGPESEPEPEPIVEKVEKQASPAFAAATEMRYAIAAAPRRSAGGMFANAVGWLALILLVLALGAATVKYRQTIASLWPQSATLYAALGMPVNLRGLEFAGVTYSDQVENGEPVLAVSGKLVNVTSHEIPVPAIRVSLSDNDKRELYHWTFAPGISMLAPGARGSFSTRLASPPSEARHVEVRFARAGE